MRRINDGKAAGLCELKLGAAKGTESSVCYIIGTGVGGGVSERDWFLPKLISVYEELCASHFAGQHFLTTRIVRCTFKNDANLIGAALRAVTDRFLSDAAVVSRTTLGETVRQAHSLRTQLYAR